MKKYLRSLILLIALLLSFSIVPQLVKGQDAGPPDGEPDDSGAYDPDAPIDGGVIVLVAVGVGYGIKRILDGRDKKLNKTT